jgi:hypothetical protein
MSWSKFTLENIKLFKLHKYDLSDQNTLLLNLRNERDRLKDFIRRNPKIKLDIRKIKHDDIIKIDEKIKNYADVDWVDKKSLINELNYLDNTMEIYWNTLADSMDGINKVNKITIKVRSNEKSKVLSRIKYLIWFIEYLKHKSLNTKLECDIWLVLSPIKKLFPNPNQIIGIKNVNTGYTDFIKNIIFVWRWEEYEKVLFHEIVHYFDMDSRNHHVNSIILSHGPHSYFEAFTDYQAVFYHLIYLGIITKHSIKLLLELELGFIRNQAIRLNNFFNLGKWKGKPNKIIKQNTPAFSYYILKYLIFKILLDNDISSFSNYNQLIKKSMELGIDSHNVNNLESSRMTLLQLA